MVSSIRGKSKEESKEPYHDPNATACCYASPMVCPIYEVMPDGSERVIGRAMYCPHRIYKERIGYTQCGKMTKIKQYRKAWPDTMPERGISHLCQDGPGFWLSFGYHVIKHKGEWTTLHAFDYLVPHEDPAKLCASARTVVNFRNKSRRVEPPAVEARSVPVAPVQQDLPPVVVEDEPPPVEDDLEDVPF